MNFQWFKPFNLWICLALFWRCGAVCDGTPKLDIAISIDSAGIILPLRTANGEYLAAGKRHIALNMQTRRGNRTFTPDSVSTKSFIVPFDRGIDFKIDTLYSGALSLDGNTLDTLQLKFVAESSCCGVPFQIQEVKRGVNPNITTSGNVEQWTIIIKR
jgi:hypothetical protein